MCLPCAVLSAGRTQAESRTCQGGHQPLSAVTLLLPRAQEATSWQWTSLCEYFLSQNAPQKASRGPPSPRPLTWPCRGKRIGSRPSGACRTPHSVPAACSVYTRPSEGQELPVWLGFRSKITLPLKTSGWLCSEQDTGEGGGKALSRTQGPLKGWGVGRAQRKPGDHTRNYLCMNESVLAEPTKPERGVPVGIASLLESSFIKTSAKKEVLFVYKYKCQLRSKCWFMEMINFWQE